VGSPVALTGMDGTRIVMVRHGESLAQELRIVGGHKGCQGLSRRGRAQVEALRDRLAGTRELGDEAVLYASVMARAVETASILAPVLGAVEIRQDCDLCEHHPGEGDGLPWEEFDERYPRPDGGRWDPDFRRDPGGETWNEMATRVAAAIDRLVERHAGGTVVVACHGGVIVQAMVRFLAMAPEAEERAWFSPENASITEWRRAVNPYRGGTLDWELVRFNDHAHLVGSSLLAAS
jgi:broad specificity phosphatase PhoE